MNNSKKHKKNLRYILIAVVALVLILLVMEGVSNLNKDKVTTKDGIEYLKEAEKGDVAVIEHKIDMLDEKDAAINDSANSNNYKSIFSNSVIMGDSISLGFSGYDFLSNSSVIAKSGLTVSNLDEQIDTVKKLKPRVIFLSYGSNDVEMYEENVSTFIRDYKKVIKTLSEELPNTKLFVNSIFPVRKDVLEKQPAYAYIDEYNKRLQKMCDEIQVAFLDNTDIVKQQYYEPDGIHFSAEFYPVWLERMAEEASL